MEERRRRCLLLLLAVSWPAAATAAVAAEACHDGGQHSAHAGCVDASGLARRHGDVWRERAGRRAGGGCVRRVSACVAGRLLRTVVPDRVENCPPAPLVNHACRMESFFSCCPIYDCPSKLASLISPLSPGQDPSSPQVETFLSRVRAPDLFSAGRLPVPVAQPQLNVTYIRRLLGWMDGRPAPPSDAQRAVQTELRHILTVLERGAAPPPEPAGARGALTLLRALPAERRRSAVLLLRLTLEKVDGKTPLTFSILTQTMLEMVGSAQAGVTLDHVLTLMPVLIQLQKDSSDTPIVELLRYIVLYGNLETDTDQTSSRPAPKRQPQPNREREPTPDMVTGKECMDNQESLVWAEMDAPVDGRCTRHVRACRAGKVVTSPALRDIQHVCDATGPEPCRMQSFFTCCPVFSCGEKARALKPEEAAKLAVQVGQANMSSVISPVPIVERSLHISTVVSMRDLLVNKTRTDKTSTPQERLLISEMDEIVSLFELGEAEKLLQRLTPILENIKKQVTLRGAAVGPATARDMLVAAHRMAELRDALESGELSHSEVPAELWEVAADLLNVLTTDQLQDVPLRPDLYPVLLSVIQRQPVTGQQLAALIGELSRVLDVWLDQLPAESFPPLPEWSPDTAPGSLAELLWLLLGVRDGDQMPLVPPASSGGPEDGPLLEALVRLVDRLRNSREPTGHLRPALVRLVRQLARPDGADSPQPVRLLLELVHRLARRPEGLQPGMLRAVTELLGRLGGLRQPDAGPHALQLLVEMVKGLPPSHRVISAETRATLVEFLQLLASRGTPPGDLRLLLTVVEYLSDVTGRDVRPEIHRQLLMLLGQMGGSPAATNSAAFQVLVRLISQLGHTQPDSENSAERRLLLQILESLAAAPEGAPQESFELVIELVELLGRPDTDTAGPEVMQLILRLIELLQRPPPQLLQLVLQLARRHGPEAPSLQPLVLAVLQALMRSDPGPRSAASDGLMQVLMEMVKGLTTVRTSQNDDSELQELLLQLTKYLSARPPPPAVRKLFVEVLLGTQTGGVSESDVMTLVLTMLELLSQTPQDTPAGSIGFNISLVDDSGPDIRDLQQLIELLLTQSWPDGSTASPADIIGFITVLMGGDEGSDGFDKDMMLRLLLDLLEKEEGRPSVPELINITTVLTHGDSGRDFTDILQLLQLLMARIELSKQQTPGFINITGTIVEQETGGLEGMQQIIEMILARMSAMADKPRESGFFNITLIDKTPKQLDELQAILETILLEIETIASAPQPTGILNISTVVFDNNRADYKKIQELVAMLLMQLSARTSTPRSPGLINISPVQEGRDDSSNVGYLLELMMSELLRESVTQPQPGFLNISGVLNITSGQDDFGDLLDLVELLLAEIKARETPSLSGFNISGILVNDQHTDMKSLHDMLQMVKSRMSSGNMPTEQLSAFRNLIMHFLSQPSGPQDIDIQGIIDMLIELAEYDMEFSTADFLALIESLNVLPTFPDIIQRLIVLLRRSSGAPFFIADLTEVAESLVRLTEVAGRPAVSPEVLIRFIVRETARPAGGGLDGLLAALVRLVEGAPESRRLPVTPPDSLPAGLRDLVLQLQLQLAAQQPRPLLQTGPLVLQLLTALPGHSQPDSLQFVAQLAAAVLSQTPDVGDGVLGPQILLHLRQLMRQPRPDRLMVVTGLLRRLLLLQQQRQPTDPSAEDDEISVTIISDGNRTNTELMTLLQGLLDGRTERDGGRPQLTDLLPRLVAVLRLAVEPPADAARLPDHTLGYVVDLIRTVLKRIEPRDDPLLPQVQVLLRRLGPRPQREALRGVLVVLEQLLVGQPEVGGAVPADLQLVLQLAEVSEHGRLADYLPLMATLLQRAERLEPAVMTYITELMRHALSRDAAQLDPLLAPRVLALIGDGADRTVNITELLPLLELLVDLQADTANEADSGDLSDLFGLLSLGGRSSTGGRDAPLDFAAWLMDLMDLGQQQGVPEVSRSLVLQVVRLLRQRPSRPSDDDQFISPEDAAQLLLLLTGQSSDPDGLSASALDSVLSLVDPSHIPRPTDTPAGLLHSLMMTVWGASGRPGTAEPAALYSQLLSVLTARPVDLPTSEAALWRALLLLLAGPEAVQPTADTTQAVHLLLTLLTRPPDSDSRPQVPDAVLHVLGSLLEAATTGGQPVFLSEPALRYLVRLLTEPEWRGPQPAPQQLTRLLATVVTATRARQGVREVALRLLLRIEGASGAQGVIPIPGDSLRRLLETPDSRSGADSDSDSDTLTVLMQLLSEHSVSGLPGGIMTIPSGHDEHEVHDDPSEHSEREHEGQHGPPAQLDSVYRQLAVMAGQPASDSPPSSNSLIVRLFSTILGEDSFDPDQIPDSVYSDLTELLSADEFDPVSAAAQAPGLLAELGGGQLPQQQLFRRLLLLLARRRGLPPDAVTPPDHLLHRCRLLCGAAGSAGVQLLPGRTPITFIGENHVVVVNG